jgi:flavin-dependent dehydrogenase
MGKHIKISGAGPAGLAAAITLARADYAVTVYEKAKDCGTRFKGDLQGLENWTSTIDVIDEMRKIGLMANNFHCAPCSSLNALAANKKITTLHSPQPFFYLVKRGARPDTLDQGLKEQALTLGVDIEFNTPVEEEEVDIVASGPVPRKLCAIDTGIIFETDAPDAAYGMLDDKSAYKGYSYLLISKGYGCMCTVLFDKFTEIHQQFALVRQTFEEITGINIRNPSRVGGYGNFSAKNKFVKGRQLYVGEAAGLQDLLWGFGIRFAFRSGYLAARCLIGGKDYAAAAKKMFADGIRAGVVNRTIWEYLGNPGYQGFLTLARRIEDPREFLYRSLSQYNWWRRLFFPLALWNLSHRRPQINY